MGKKITIIDKTVPSEDYREHHGLTWIMNYLHYATPNHDKSLDPERDYIGYKPTSDSMDSIDILKDEVNQSDIIYIADTYGVYEQEDDGEQITTNKITGGLSEEELAIIDNKLQQDPTKLFMEFNTFASPTSSSVRQQVTSMLDTEWTGWTGRYFSTLDLDTENEIPEWIERNYQEQYNQSWSFTNGGFVFTHEDGRIIIIEHNNTNDGILFSFTDIGEEITGIKNSQAYGYWFDIHVSKDTNNVLAEYKLELNDEQLKILEEEGIPSTFPAVFSSQYHNSMLYYFAGDFVDIGSIPSFYQYKGLPLFHQLKSMFTQDTQKAFFWRTYMPMVQELLKHPLPIVEEENEVSIYEEEEVKQTARLKDARMEIYTDDKWSSILIKGVNIGMAKPGYFPGEAAITEEEYFRWFELIGEMNANTLRVYTIHPPGFYRALNRYNQQSASPLYVLHGVWIEEEPFQETPNALDATISRSFEQNIEDTIDVIHGNANLPERDGHASGLYQADISPYVIGYIIGIEWDPLMVENTNHLNKEYGQFNGTFIQTKDANPFEYWLGSMLDHTAIYEQENYNWQRPLSFTNWVTTDLLDHPYEPLDEEDLVSVDPNHITGTSSHLPGLFASYHVYPYYPDFLNHTPGYLSYTDHRGEQNSYAGYLNDLKQAHNMPVLVAEFGVPASRGKTHSNPYGWNQGGLSEEEQGNINKHLYEDITNQDYMGGLLFSWQDEWFKRTWNTMELDDPDRRPYWSNVQTNEQRFGLLSFDRFKINVDGELSDWKEAKEVTTISGQQKGIDTIQVTQDETYLYTSVQFDSNQIAQGLPDSYLLLNTIPNQGNKTVPFDQNITLDKGIDFIVQLSENKANVLVDGYYDAFDVQYGNELNQESTETLTVNSGKYHPIRLALNKQMTIPIKDELLAFEYYETGVLTEGTANPTQDNYNSLTDYNFNEKNGVLEIRIPWLLLHVKDPSQRKILGDIRKDGLDSEQFIDDISIGFVSYLNKNKPTVLAEEQNTVRPTLYSHTWNTWDLPKYKERLKKSYYIMQEAFTPK
ncbi:hypothetical protein [Aquibacillus rhizosphaerae]|uniref:Uncharacterized protein n=1 Tax=Aquibacillus rhizosphaerae TaxID=3051431 RepID=A0ABT7LAJ9_9BACI|nr:hypothetical protein [Aquibacillus sp. LR5S19]MDL4842896.1 hypothetical protein [Aquibacillus sp. LR5S19]